MQEYKIRAYERKSNFTQPQNWFLYVGIYTGWFTKRVEKNASERVGLIHG